MMYGKDYRQIVDDRLDEKLAEVEEIRDSIELLMSEIKWCSKSFRENHADLFSFCEDWVSTLNDEIKGIEQEINGELDSVDSTWCD